MFSQYIPTNQRIIMNEIIKGIIFDMDGVIIQTCDLHKLAWEKAGALYGYEWPQNLNFKKDVFGTVSEDSAKLIFGTEQIGDNLEQLIVTKDSFYEYLLEYEVENIVLPGFIQFLASLKEMKFLLGLATSAKKEEVEMVLKKLNVYHLFDSIVDISQVKNAKPDPEIYLLTLSKLGLSGRECIAFEDSVSGIKAVNGANVNCAVVMTTLDKELLVAKKLEYKYTLNDFTEIPTQLKTELKKFYLQKV